MVNGTSTNLVEASHSFFIAMHSPAIFAGVCGDDQPICHARMMPNPLLELILRMNAAFFRDPATGCSDRTDLFEPEA